METPQQVLQASLGPRVEVATPNNRLPGSAQRLLQEADARRALIARDGGRRLASGLPSAGRALLGAKAAVTSGASQCSVTALEAPGP